VSEPADSQETPAARRERPPLPPWFRIRLPHGSAQATLKQTSDTVEAHALHTVCQEAHCPNLHDCWGRGTATFMIGGQVCTRGCRFCAVGSRRHPPPPDPDEPHNLAEAVKGMDIAYAVITCVNRDDLEDDGAAHFRACLDAVHATCPDVGLEFLGSDMNGNEPALARLLDGAPLNVFAHNVETVERLTPDVRDGKTSYRRSLRILEAARERRPDLLTKSSLMVGFGETNEEVTATMRDLRSVGVTLMTLGQYLAPSQAHYPVMSYPTPEQFDAWRDEALALGFLAVASAPLVRSSFRAGSLYLRAGSALKC
jgi:lipoic acid synthetase